MKLNLDNICFAGIVLSIFLAIGYGLASSGEATSATKQVVYAVTDGACALPVQSCEGIVTSDKATVVFCSCKPLTEVTYEF